MSIRVVVADDHPMYLLGLAAVLAQADDIDVVAQASNGNELLAAASAHLLEFDRRRGFEGSRHSRWTGRRPISQPGVV